MNIVTTSFKCLNWIKWRRISRRDLPSGVKEDLDGENDGAASGHNTNRVNNWHGTPPMISSGRPWYPIGVPKVPGWQPRPRTVWHAWYQKREGGHFAWHHLVFNIQPQSKDITLACSSPVQRIWCFHMVKVQPLPQCPPHAEFFHHFDKLVLVRGEHFMVLLRWRDCNLKMWPSPPRLTPPGCQWHTPSAIDKL